MVENVVAKGENAGFQQFILLPQCFLKLAFHRSFKPGYCVRRFQQYNQVISLFSSALKFFLKDYWKSGSHFWSRVHGPPVPVSEKFVTVMAHLIVSFTVVFTMTESEILTSSNFNSLPDDIYRVVLMENVCRRQTES